MFNGSDRPEPLHLPITAHTHTAGESCFSELNSSQTAFLQHQKLLLSARQTLFSAVLLTTAALVHTARTVLLLHKN